VTERPLTRPDHLDSMPTTGWIARNPAGCVALAVGVIGFAIVVLSQQTLWSPPDGRIAWPVLGAVGVASAIALVRRERGFATWLVGLGFAAAGLVLGWFVMFAIVIAATALIAVILHAVM
jgi:hypothetical protein